VGLAVRWLRNVISEQSREVIPLGSKCGISGVNAMDRIYSYGCLILEASQVAELMTRYQFDRVATCKAWQHDEVSRSDLPDWLVCANQALL